jgi:hypothetical protein
MKSARKKVNKYLESMKHKQLQMKKIQEVSAALMTVLI